MLNSFVSALALTAVSGLAVGVACHRSWVARAAKKKRRIPAQWRLQARPLLAEMESVVWHWLQRAFFDYHVLVKIPVIRFMSARTVAEGKHSHELLSGVYCTFTVCAADGTVIGCLDVPGPQGLKASNRDLKQKLFAECGIAYAVVRASNLPTLEAVRAAFLGDIDLSDDEPAVFGQPPLAQPLSADVEAEAFATVPHTMRSASGAVLEDMPEIDMTAMAAARSSLQAKLERNRRIRFTSFDPLSTGSGIVQDNADHNFAEQWEDSFITPDDVQPPDDAKRHDEV